jgi:hypothetical protein
MFRVVAAEVLFSQIFRTHIQLLRPAVAELVDTLQVHIQQELTHLLLSLVPMETPSLQVEAHLETAVQFHQVQLAMVVEELAGSVMARQPTIKGVEQPQLQQQL